MHYRNVLFYKFSRQCLSFQRTRQRNNLLIKRISTLAEHETSWKQFWNPSTLAASRAIKSDSLEGRYPGTEIFLSSLGEPNV